MNKNFLIFVGLCGVICSAISLVYGRGILTTSSIVMFTILSLLIPLVLKQVKRLPFVQDLPVNMWYHVFSWLWWTIFFFMGTVGTMQLAINPERILVKAALWFVVYISIFMLIELTAVLLTYFFKRNRYIEPLDDAIDMCVYSLPVPMLLLGNVLFINVQDPLMAAYFSSVIAQTLMTFVLLLIVVTMLVVALYLYPRKGIEKVPRLVRIFGTVLIWLAINGHMLYGYIPPAIMEWVFVAVPVFKGNVLVYITPTIFEIVVMIIAVYSGIYLEKGFFKVFHKKADVQ